MITRVSSTYLMWTAGDACGARCMLRKCLGELVDVSNTRSLRFHWYRPVAELVHVSYGFKKPSAAMCVCVCVCVCVNNLR